MRYANSRFNILFIFYSMHLMPVAIPTVTSLHYKYGL